MTTTGILLFDDAEELDFVGPWEVFTMARMLDDAHAVFTVARTRGPVRGAKGLRVLPDHDFGSAPPMDVLVVPGGIGTRRLIQDAAMVGWVREVASRCTWVTSVCTGALVLAQAGLLQGRRATTHWIALDELRAFEGVTVLDGVRYARDGNVVTASGVSAGIDMALWLLGALTTPERAREVQRMMQYDPAPPYQALT
jgi:transcriptional regulator GlxA family with amidase domain